MRYRLATLCLIVLLPVVNAAPAPDPYVILDIGPPAKGESDIVHRQTEINCLTHPHGMISRAWREAEAHNLQSIPPEDKRPLDWLAKRVVVKQDGDGNCLRITFHGGTRAEQVVILNALARVYVRLYKEDLAGWEESIRRTQRTDADDHLARLRQVRVVRWAK